MPLIKKDIQQVAEQPLSKGVTVEKYMIEITRYPDGKAYTKMYPVGEQKIVNKVLQKPAKGVTKINLKEKEVEELE